MEKEKISLKERFEKYKGPNLCKEFSWDEPVGKEKLDNIDNSI